VFSHLNREKAKLEGERLRLALEKSGGRAVFVVHPFYHESNPKHYARWWNFSDCRVPSKTAKGRAFLKTVNRLLETHERREGLPALIVFEEGSRVEETRKTVGGKAFFVPTEKTNPTPLCGWENALKELRESGLKHALVSGQKLFGLNESELYAMSRAFSNYVYSNPTALTASLASGLKENLLFMKSAAENFRDSEKKPLGACVGMTVSALLHHGFRVSVLPKACYPFQLTAQKPFPTLFQRIKKRLGFRRKNGGKPEENKRR